MRMPRLAYSFAAAALSLASTVSQAQQSLPVITIVGPMTGPLAGNGQDMVAGAKAAREDLRKTGQDFILHFEDDACSESQAVNVANRIVSSGGRYVVGHYCSNATLPASDVYNEAGIVQITLSQAAKITKRGHQRLFRITPSADALADGYIRTIAAEAAQNPAARFALIGNSGDYARSIADAIQSKLKDSGITLSHRAFYAPEDTDYAAIITRLRQERITDILIAGSEREMGMIVRQSGEIHGYRPRFLLSSTALSQGFAGIVGCAGDNVRAVAAWNPLYAPGQERLAASLLGAGANGLDTAVNTYAAVTALAQAIGASGSGGAAQVARNLHENTFRLPVGNIQFTGNGESNSRVITYQYQQVGTPCRHIEPRPLSP